MEYYQPVFSWLHETRSQEIHEALLIHPDRRFGEFFSSFDSPTEFFGSMGHDRLRSYLPILEADLKAILSKHSIFYWLHLYRRIAPVLSPYHKNKTDQSTTALVRDIVECAICKFGRRDDPRDIRLSGGVAPDQILGGLFIRRLKKTLPDRRERERYIDRLRDQNQFVLCDFKIRDFVAIYGAEGLAYEYWQATARLRTVGKGARLTFVDGRLDYQHDAELELLIDSFDERIAEGAVMPTTSGGILAPNLGETVKTEIFSTRYNVERDHAEELTKELGLVSLPGAPLFNFLPQLIPKQSIEAGHEYLAPHFEKERGYSLSSFLLVIAALSWRALFPERTISRLFEGKKSALPAALAQILRRAYTAIFGDIESVTRSVLFYLEHFCAKEGETLPTESIVRKVLADLTLDCDQKQEKISLWTRGPKFVLLNSASICTIDTLGIAQLISTLFVGLRHSAQERGDTFEDLVRAHLRSHEFQLLGRRIVAQGVAREADAVVRVGSTLWLIEAFSMERPLDFEIGKPSVIEVRIDRLQAKVDQAASVRSMVEANPVGDNYDFRWATRIEHCVVSPFVEWVWSRNAALWIDEETPRILSVAELLRALNETEAAYHPCE